MMSNLYSPTILVTLYSNTDDITVTAMSSNITLITSTNIVISGAANNILNTSATENMPLNLTLYITSNSGQFGRSLITTMVTDSYGMTHTQSFFYEIMPAEQKIIASDGETDDRFATDISISDHYAIVGAHYDDDIATNSGAAYIFSKTQIGWTESAKLSASDAQASDYFGYAVSISGDFALVAPMLKMKKEPTPVPHISFTSRTTGGFKPINCLILPAQAAINLAMQYLSPAITPL